MLTRMVRIQLAIFTVAAIVGVTTMAVRYLQVPTLLGLGRYSVTVQLPTTGGLYRFSNVTYMGIQVGKVTEVRATRSGAEATLELNTSPKIPADVSANVASMSAVGEQFVDLRPRHANAPFLHDGSVIRVDNTSTPQPIGPVLDSASALMASVPQDTVSKLLDEAHEAFGGSGYDLGSLFDSSARIAADGKTHADTTQQLINDTAPLLDSQEQGVDALRTWTERLASVTGTVAANDKQVRDILTAGPPAAQEVSKLLDQVKPTLPLLLANLTTVGQIAVTYHPSLEQILVLLPPSVAALQGYGVSSNNSGGFPLGDFTLKVSDPPACTVGFLPPSQWRSPADTSVIDTPDGIYCKLPQDSPISVRGARNYPCEDRPGRRAPTVELCHSDMGYRPLAIREHALGPYPLDPNLISQGIPPDDRVDFNDRIYAPVEGTPPPPPQETPQAQNPPQAAPSSFSGPTAGPSVAFAQYNPQNGQYATPDGQVFQQSNLADGAAAASWKDLLPH
jgi:virulence factor Mce-like protein